tara:strand:- start:5832 stop:8135 length:2304 start_codon:yes stop_codon:yes gene_type:complete
MVKIESKEKLAKLLAMEDLNIQHRNVKTAMFDVKNRCLTLPVWKDMPNHVYDLLVGHEVGHALYTPNDEEKLTKLIKKTSKHCVNVVEDARIESLIKKKYPGLVKQFYNGYKHLVQEDFFGLSQVKPEELNLLDKINLHFKVPTTVAGLFEFDEKEEKIVKKIEKIRKFDELEKVCIEICKYLKENKKEEEKDSIFDEDSHVYNNEDQENEDGEFGEPNDSEAEENDTESKSGESDEDQEASNESPDDNEGDENAPDTKQEENNDNSDENEGETNSLPEPNEDMDADLSSKTYENFEHNKDELSTNSSNNDRDYLYVPEGNFNNVIDYKKVYKNIDEYYSLDHFNKIKSLGQEALSQRYDWYFQKEQQFLDATKRMLDGAKETVKNIKKESEKTVNHMAMEFERKKCADVYKRTLVAKTGVLDTNKLFSAKYNEDVFKKNVRVPDGKSHGLVMIVDWSGSMAGNMKGCVKQLIELVLFCKKVNIPFEVYSFTDIRTSDGEKKKKSFDFREGDLITDETVSLRNYLSSRMTVREFNEALVKLCIISNSFDRGYYCYPIPPEDRLGYTPLNGAILTSEKVIRRFKETNNLQEVHSVWITDGDGNNVWGKYSQNKRQNRQYTANVFIQDTKTKTTYGPMGRRNLTETLFDVLKKRLGCNVVGFFLDNDFARRNHLTKYYYNQGFNSRKSTTNNINEFVSKAKKNGYIILEDKGYDEYYVISSTPKSEKVVEIEEKMTASRMATLFSKKATTFKQSRVILSRFIDLITKNI